MSDLLENASSWLADQRAKFLSHLVSYRRGEQSVDLQAGYGDSSFDVIDESGISTAWESKDFLIRAADLVLAGHVIEPREGDRIVDGGRTFQVIAPPGVKAWKYDPYRKNVRVHTKQISVE